MRKKGKLVSWKDDKGFGFIQPSGGGSQIFIHKTAFTNRARTPMVNDIITFSDGKGNDGRLSARDATFSGEKLQSKPKKKEGKVSVYLALLFLMVIAVGYLAGYIPETLLLAYVGFSVLTFLVYWVDKAKAQRGAWRTQESSLHILSLLGGWPGAAIAQQLLRHKSKKREFRQVFWMTVLLNIAALAWLCSASGSQYLSLFY
ncbi:MAG: cold shock and DUF1294 domain-containing protein [Paraglaciecola sp.]|uniref:cold shock and DUF1294 domain-containing protein n=1 Tax=Paraglaciecola sp. TaxID=1920173 RepID=UPI003296E0EC